MIRLLPLALLSDVSPEAMPEVVQRIEKRFAAEVADVSVVAELWTATKVMLGLRYDDAFVEPLLRGVLAMKESSTYQAIMREGAELERPKEARRMLLLQGKARFKSPPTPQQLGELEAITEVDRLHDLGIRLLTVDTWAELLNG